MREATKTCWEDARRRFAGVVLDRATFEAHLEAFAERAPAHAQDIFLALSAARGDARGAFLVERDYFPPRGLLSGGDQALHDQRLQSLREKLFVGPPPALLKYSGNAPLGPWIRLVARRMVYDELRANARAQKREADWLREPQRPKPGLESQLEDAREIEAFRCAIDQAIRELPARDRALLRLHYANGATVEALGRAFGVHKATAARWLSRIREALCDAVREKLQRVRGLSDEQFDQLAQDLRSRIELSLSSWRQDHRCGPQQEEP